MSEAVQTQSEVVQFQIEDGVALLTLNRPDRLNAWTAEMERAYFAMLEECAASEDVRVIVVTGAGRGFCAGADMQELQALGDGGTTRRSSREPSAAPQTLPAVDPQADHRRDQRRVRGHRAGAGADVRRALRRRGGQAHDRVRPPRAGRRARHLVDPAAADRARRARSTCCSPGASCSPRRRSSSGSSTACSRPSGCSRRRSTTRASSPSTARRRAWPR